MELAEPAQTESREVMSVLEKGFRLFLIALSAWSGMRVGMWGAGEAAPEVIGLSRSQYLMLLGFVGAILGLILSSLLIGLLRQGLAYGIAQFQKMPLQDIVAGAIGLLVGLLIALLATVPLPDRVPLVGEYLPALVTAAFGYVCVVVAVRKREDLFFLFGLGRVPERGNERGRPALKGGCKVLDTSVIIDGRIADICKTGFLEGPLVVPAFVLAELQQIADSPDVLKRNRGRRGLDILNKIQKESPAAVQVMDRDFEDAPDVDAKLVRLAMALDGKVVTNDYNLNKVSELQGVPVLNINELANAVKPVVLPGEEMVVHLIKDGKEHGQGVGYLDDGTMIVVDGGRRYIGESIGVHVTSVLQTAAGRMIFARPKAMEKAL